MVHVRITSTGKHYLMGKRRVGIWEEEGDSLSYSGEMIGDPQVSLPSRPPLPPGAISGRPHTQPLPRNTEQILPHSGRGQSTLDRLIIAVVVFIVCWLIVQHAGQLTAS